MHRILIVCQYLISAPQPICCISEPTELGCGNPSLFQWRMQGTTSYCLTVSYERTQTKTNNCTTIFLPTLVIHFVCQRSSYISPIHLSYKYCSDYHRLLLRNYRSSQIEQQDILHCLLTFNKQISKISPVLAPVLVASTSTTTSFYFQSIFKPTAPTTTLQMAPFSTATLLLW